jgi:hypothetical protein
MAGFVAVVLPGSAPVDAVLRAAGATAVLQWSELATSAEPDETPTVVFDVGSDEAATTELADDVAAALDALTSAPGAAIATVRPVTDTLKLVDGDGFLAGTAEREQHRFVGAPIAARLQVLRALSLEPENRENVANPERTAPTSLAVLLALADRGVRVLAGRG